MKAKIAATHETSFARGLELDLSERIRISNIGRIERLDPYLATDCSVRTSYVAFSTMIDHIVYICVIRDPIRTAESPLRARFPS